MAAKKLQTITAAEQKTLRRLVQRGEEIADWTDALLFYLALDDIEEGIPGYKATEDEKHLRRLRKKCLAHLRKWDACRDTHEALLRRLGCYHEPLS